MFRQTDLVNELSILNLLDHQHDNQKMRERNEKMFVIRLICSVLIALTVSAGAGARADEKYPVSLLVSGVDVQRVGDVLFRYIEFFEEYPCLRLETIRPISHELIDRIEACVFTIDGNTIDVRREDLAGVGYKDYKFERGVFRFTADIVLGGPGPGISPLNCKVTISNAGKLSEPLCRESEPTVDSGDVK